MSLLYFDADDVLSALSYEACISSVRQAMIDHSDGKTRHLLRSFIPLGEDRIFAQMPAALSVDGYFGAKLVSVFADQDRSKVRRHRGLVVLFEGSHGNPVAIADAEAITLIRTAAASAVATSALARPDSSTLVILGTGRQAKSHIEALATLDQFHHVIIWGRSVEKAENLAQIVRQEHRFDVTTAPSVDKAVADADVICTVTSASKPILLGDWVKPGTHVNLVGSSVPGPTEVDNDLIANSTFIADCRLHVSKHGAELINAIRDGAVGKDHIAAEIGEVLVGSKPGRQRHDEITVYKSLGHAVQDLAAVAFLYESRNKKSAILRDNKSTQ